VSNSSTKSPSDSLTAGDTEQATVRQQRKSSECQNNHNHNRHQTRGKSRPWYCSNNKKRRFFARRHKSSTSSTSSLAANPATVTTLPLVCQNYPHHSHVNFYQAQREHQNHRFLYSSNKQQQQKQQHYADNSCDNSYYSYNNVDNVSCSNDNNCRKNYYLNTYGNCNYTSNNYEPLRHCNNRPAVCGNSTYYGQCFAPTTHYDNKSMPTIVPMPVSVIAPVPVTVSMLPLPVFAAMHHHNCCERLVSPVSSDVGSSVSVDTASGTGSSSLRSLVTACGSASGGGADSGLCTDDTCSMHSDDDHHDNDDDGFELTGSFFSNSIADSESLINGKLEEQQQQQQQHDANLMHRPSCSDDSGLVDDCEWPPITTTSNSVSPDRRDSSWTMTSDWSTGTASGSGNSSNSGNSTGARHSIVSLLSVAVNNLSVLDTNLVQSDSPSDGGSSTCVPDYNAAVTNCCRPVTVQSCANQPNKPNVNDQLLLNIAANAAEEDSKLTATTTNVTTTTVDDKFNSKKTTTTTARNIDKKEKNKTLQIECLGAHDFGSLRIVHKSRLVRLSNASGASTYYNNNNKATLVDRSNSSPDTASNLSGISKLSLMRSVSSSPACANTPAPQQSEAAVATAAKQVHLQGNTRVNDARPGVHERNRKSSPMYHQRRRRSSPAAYGMLTGRPPARLWTHVAHADPDKHQLTVMCYNVLCEHYATNTRFSYCPPWALDWGHRRASILHEILMHNADIVALQEVESGQFRDYFGPQLSEAGYGGVFEPKSRAKTMHEPQVKQQVDGCAIFYKRSRYQLKAQHLIEYNQLAMANAQGSTAMLNRVMTRDNIGLVAVLELIDDNGDDDDDIDENSDNNNNKIEDDQVFDDSLTPTIKRTKPTSTTHAMSLSSQSSTESSISTSYTNTNISANRKKGAWTTIAPNQPGAKNLFAVSDIDWPPLNATKHRQQHSHIDTSQDDKSIIDNIDSPIDETPKSDLSSDCCDDNPVISNNNHRPGKQKIVVANTHLHWDPQQCDVKLVQTIMLMNELRNIATQHSAQPATGNSCSSQMAPLILCGDFNSMPNSNVVEFITQGRISSQARDFKRLGADYEPCLRHAHRRTSTSTTSNTCTSQPHIVSSTPLSPLTNIPVVGYNRSTATAGDTYRLQFYSHPFEMATSNHELPFTTFTSDFKQVIDYVFYSRDKIRLTASLGPIDKRWFSHNHIAGLPHPHVPSDHVPVLVKLELNDALASHHREPQHTSRQSNHPKYK
ncbi:CCR4-NOT transcription complex subunit 6, partial [Fragariocoptes setiger]